ncbi:metabotropic glutamate receptor 3 [Hydra vulgaris]|uniref:Metabotropic glutamate receptor 3 n=1 Tax=Hydra vulgaris TaxID=6087 RepID=A0ABM4C609_HYDVU
MRRVFSCSLFYFCTLIKLKLAKNNCGDSNVSLRHFTNATFFIGGIFPIYHLQNESYTLNEGAILWVSSMMLAIQEINENNNILPGIKIGYDIRDSRNDVFCACQHVLDFLLNKSINPIMIGVIGPASSSLSVAVSTLLLPDYIPQISHSSTSMILSQRSVYRNFLRTVPPDVYQAKALLDLIDYFRWTYISLFASDDEYGRFGLEEVRKAATEKNICFSVEQLFGASIQDEEVDEVLESIKRNSRIVILWCDSHNAIKIISKSLERGLQDINWIGTESWGNDIVTMLKQYSFLTHNIFVLRLKEYNIKNLHDEIHNANVASKINCDNPWYNEFLSKHTKDCPELIPSLSTMLSKRKTTQVFSAVYALAYGLHSYLNCSFTTCVTSSERINYQLLYKHVVNTSFFVPASNYSVRFDINGDFSLSAYEYILVDQISFTEFGTWEYHFNKPATIDINRSKISWKNISTPKTVCSTSCYPGTYRLNSTESKCCWFCTRCKKGYITRSMNEYECKKCPLTTLENLNQTQCNNLTEVRLKIYSTTGIIIIVGSLLGVFFTIVVFIFYLFNWNNPIVKGANREMSCIQLFSLKFLFLFSFLFFEKPTPMLCMLRSSLFGFLFTTILAFVVVKTYRLVRVFNGRFTKVSKYLENKFQVFFSFLLVFIQTSTVVIWHIYHPTNIQTIPDSNRNNYYLVCDNEKPLFWISLTYFCILAIVSGYMAFRARKLPENFNETQYIAYAMFTVCVFWFTYIPIHFSVDPHESIVAFLCINLLSCYSMLITLYGKKISYVLYYSKLNKPKLSNNSSIETISCNFNFDEVVQTESSLTKTINSEVVCNKYAHAHLDSLIPTL